MAGMAQVNFSSEWFNLKEAYVNDTEFIINLPNLGFNANRIAKSNIRVINFHITDLIANYQGDIRFMAFGTTRPLADRAIGSTEYLLERMFTTLSTYSVEENYCKFIPRSTTFFNNSSDSIFRIFNITPPSNRVINGTEYTFRRINERVNLTLSSYGFNSERPSGVNDLCTLTLDLNGSGHGQRSHEEYDLIKNYGLQRDMRQKEMRLSLYHSILNRTIREIEIDSKAKWTICETPQPASAKIKS